MWNWEVMYLMGSDQDVIERMKIPGGWLWRSRKKFTTYNLAIGNMTTESMALTFQPETPPSGAD